MARVLSLAAHGVGRQERRQRVGRRRPRSASSSCVRGGGRLGGGDGRRRKVARRAQKGVPHGEERAVDARRRRGARVAEEGVLASHHRHEGQQLGRDLACEADQERPAAGVGGCLVEATQPCHRQRTHAELRESDRTQRTTRRAAGLAAGRTAAAAALCGGHGAVRMGRRRHQMGASLVRPAPRGYHLLGAARQRRRHPHANVAAPERLARAKSAVEVAGEGAALIGEARALLLFARRGAGGEGVSRAYLRGDEAAAEAAKDGGQRGEECDGPRQWRQPRRAACCGLLFRVEEWHEMEARREWQHGKRPRGQVRRKRAPRRDARAVGRAVALRMAHLPPGGPPHVLVVAVGRWRA